MPKPLCTCSLYANEPNRWCKKHKTLPSLALFGPATDTKYPSDERQAVDRGEAQPASFHGRDDSEGFYVPGRPPARRAECGLSPSGPSWPDLL